MNIKSQILDAIDDINIITAECEYSTICEMYNSYDKASLILEYYEGDNVDAFNVFDDTDNFYQESSVSDKMKASGKKYNTFMKIITFIPRLIKALFQTISEKFKKIKPSKELQKAPKEVKEKLTTAFDKKKDKKKRIATVASLILGAGAVGVATKVGSRKLSERNYKKSLGRLVNASDQFFKELEDRNMSLDDLADYREDFKDKVEKSRDLLDIIFDKTRKFKERKRAIREDLVLLDEMKKDVMKIEAVPKDNKENVVKGINELEEELTKVSNVSDEDALNEVIDDSSVTDTSSTDQNNQEVEKKAERIVDIIDSKLEDINKRYKNLVNKLYSHDAMQLPSEEYQSVDVKFNDKKDGVACIVDKSAVGSISCVGMHKSLFYIYQLFFTLTRTYGDDVNKIDKEINELFEKFKNDKKGSYHYNKFAYYSGNVDYDINAIEKDTKDIQRSVNKFNQRSDKDKELLMAKQSVQNAIKTLNDEVKFYRDIFYEFLSLSYEFTKLIDDTYSSLSVKASDQYKFDENAEKFSKINTDISLS